jgi:hypothetical protein
MMNLENNRVVVRTGAALRTEVTSADEGPWPAPTPLKVALPPIDSLDPGLIPEPLRAWVFDVSERMDNGPPDFIAAGVELHP